MIPELDEHDLGECEGLFGYLCEDCRVWYQERADELERSWVRFQPAHPQVPASGASLLPQEPVTRALVDRAEDWAWSSYRYYEFGDESVLKLVLSLEGMGWDGS